MQLLDELENLVLPGDGAMGTRLIELGVPLGRCFEELCVTQPDLVRGIHESYLHAGARLIRTNSFGANPVRLVQFGLANRVNEINWTAAQLAREAARAAAKGAAKGSKVYVAGSVGPLGITAAEAKEQGIDRKAAFQEQIGALLDGGVNLIFLETFLDLEELKLALYVKQSLHHCPVICSMACTAQGCLPSGQSIREALEILRQADAEIVGMNCVESTLILDCLEQSGPLCQAPQPSTPITPFFAAFPSAGLPSLQQGRWIAPVTPAQFAADAQALAARGARLIGGCCGAGPEHITAMVEALETTPPAAPGANELRG